MGKTIRGRKSLGVRVGPDAELGRLEARCRQKATSLLPYPPCWLYSPSLLVVSPSWAHGLILRRRVHARRLRVV